MCIFLSFFSCFKGNDNCDLPCRGTEGHNSNLKKNAEIRDAKEVQVFIMRICSK